ncbi:MAG: hypothetical protein AAGG01_07465 [Planctomycetota bacterium]
MNARPSESWSTSQWEGFLEGHFDFPIRVVYGRSRTAPVQARALRVARRSGVRTRSSRVSEPATEPIHGWELRLHRQFASAPRTVREALATWLRSGRRATKAGPILDAWIHAEIASLPPQERRVTLDSGGLHHPLGRMAERLFETEFKNDFLPSGESQRPRISWGRRGLSRSRRSLRLGSFEPTARIVRVHPVLDQAAVPEWFVRFVLKHEILHACIETYRDSSGRWVHHGPEFRQREQSWPEYEAAVLWEERNLARVIRSAREGTQLRVRPEDLIDPAPKAALSAGPLPVEGSDAKSAAQPSEDDSAESQLGRKEAPRQPLLPF